jgi:tetratricopeptide (TPR) repeat protein
MVLYSHWLLGKLELLEGHAEAARARIESVYGDRRLQWESRTEVLPILGETYLALGDVDKAGEIAAESVALARDHEYMLALVGALDVQGTVRFVQGRWEEAEALFDEAVSLAHPMPYPYGEALVLYHWGLMHLERQDRDRAQDRLAAAQVIFRRLGARPDLERAEQALARLSTPR